MKTMIAGICLLVLTACAGVPSAISEAERVCTARGHSAGSAAYGKCVFDVTESIYDRWGRKHISRGD